jgi:hypothetical protein
MCAVKLCGPQVIKNAATEKNGNSVTKPVLTFSELT